MEQSKFITFEGGEGSGKSTQIKLLQSFLSKKGIESLRTREPGGNSSAELIRELLVNGDIGKWDPKSEVLLHFAARRNHIKNTIAPALHRGSWVLCDRFADSTAAYQGSGLGVNKVVIDFLYKFIVESFTPDLTFVLDVPVEVGLERARLRDGNKDRYEKMNKDFHSRVREGFLGIAENSPSRCVIIDGQNSIDETSKTIIDEIKRKFDV